MVGLLAEAGCEPGHEGRSSQGQRRVWLTEGATGGLAETARPRATTGLTPEVWPLRTLPGRKAPPRMRRKEGRSRKGIDPPDPVPDPLAESSLAKGSPPWTLASDSPGRPRGLYRAPARRPALCRQPRRQNRSLRPVQAQGRGGWGGSVAPSRRGVTSACGSPRRSGAAGHSRGARGRCTGLSASASGGCGPAREGADGLERPVPPPAGEVGPGSIPGARFVSYAHPRPHRELRGGRGGRGRRTESCLPRPRCGKRTCSSWCRWPRCCGRT